MSTTPTPKRRGRPPLDPAKRLVNRTLRLSTAHWDKLEALGGVEWLRKALGEASVPAPSHAPRRATARAKRLADLFVLD